MFQKMNYQKDLLQIKENAINFLEKALEVIYWEPDTCFTTK